MPVILKLTEYEAGLVVDALANGRASLMKQWGSVFEQEVYDDGMLLLSKDSILENLDDNIAALGWVRKRLARAVVDTPPEGGKPEAVWHHKRGWIHSVDEIRKAAKAVAAGELTREEVAEAMGFDLEGIDAENARDRVRIQLGDATFYDCRLQSTLADGTAQDQIAPGAWTTLPDGLDLDVDPFEITDPEEKFVIAAADTQTDGTVVGFHRYSLTTPEKQISVLVTVNGKTDWLSGNATEVEKAFKELTSAVVS